MKKRNYMQNIKKGILYFTLLLAVLVMLPTNVHGASKVALNKKDVTLYVGKSLTLKVTGTKEKITWTTSDKKIVTVNSKGKVTAKKVGMASVTANVGGKKYACIIRVQKPALNSTELTLLKGKTYTLKLTGTKAKSYSSGKKAIATVNNKGKITAKKPGRTTITVKGADGKKYKCTVTVSTKPFLSSTKKTLYVGNTYTLKLTGTKAKSYSSSKKAIATVNNKGTITAKKAGKAVITVSGADGKKYKCTITVKKLTPAVCQHTGETRVLAIDGTTHSICCYDCRAVLSTESCNYSSGACACGISCPHNDQTVWADENEDGNCGTICNDCGSEWSGAHTTYWTGTGHQCSSCGTFWPCTHTYPSIGGSWEDGHSWDCFACGAELGTEAHTFSGGSCTACGWPEPTATSEEAIVTEPEEITGAVE